MRQPAQGRETASRWPQVAPAIQLHGVDRLGERRPGVPAGVPLQQRAAEPDHPVRGAAVLRRDGVRTSSGMGYKRTDVFRVYAFNLILLPVNLAGTFKSLQQAAAKSKIPFARTPKVKNRTAAPALFVLGAVLIAGYSFYTLQHDLRVRQLEQCGLRRLQRRAHDLRDRRLHRGAQLHRRRRGVGMANWVRVPVARSEATQHAGRGSRPARHDLDWESVLYFGPGVSDSRPSAFAARAPPSPPRPRRAGRASLPRPHGGLLMSIDTPPVADPASPPERTSRISPFRVVLLAGVTLAVVAGIVALAKPVGRPRSDARSHGLRSVRRRHGDPDLPLRDAPRAYPAGRDPVLRRRVAR